MNARSHLRSSLYRLVIICRLGGVSIICMWDTLTGKQTGHGDGRVNNVTQAAQAWRIIAAAPGWGDYA